MGMAATGNTAVADDAGAAASASPSFFLLGEALSEDDEDEEVPYEDEEIEEEEEEELGSDEARFDGDATAGAAPAVASSEPIRSGKLSSAREPRIR